MNNGPELWTKVLALMPPGAIIAGGCVRDYLLEVAPKDIDVFFAEDSLPMEEENGLFGFRLERPIGFQRIDNAQERSVEYADAVQNFRCISRGSVDGWQVDACEIGDTTLDPVKLVNDFDFGITRCWFDGFQIFDTPEARFDRSHKIVTLYNSERMKRATRRFESFNKRHDGAYRLEIASA